ncbi:LamB/YcsF family protein [Paenibacillus mendelii]|uniref:5-oxoprolinase subunit A n=1 Tax=Paenibacillus mendelii TaxID=206163 RepID=A0ABV6J909_9BACL|nr:5-oxoprolinase subunit PxpA [Paenibacillus mendelii]MCQ6559606.1 LamB/YcsF family protein [Paenibacillus mendelii]
MISNAEASFQSKVDLNCDFGEGYGIYTFGQDEKLLQYVTSVNIACGFHAGDPKAIRQAVASAAEAGVAIGAHPGLPDRLGFGRREMAVEPDDVYDDTLYQIGALGAFVRAAGTELRHLKPHGALYHMAGRSEAIADAIIRAAKAYDPKLRIYGQHGSLLLRAAELHGLRAVSEVFADRTYMADGTLTPRILPGAMIQSRNAALDQALRMVIQGVVLTPSGDVTAVQADTICLHGDGPHAASFAAAIHDGLTGAGIRLERPE